MIVNAARTIKTRMLLGIGLSLSLISLSPGQTPVSVHGQLRVDGNRIVDKNGQSVALHGMSMYAWANQGLQFYNATAVRRLVQEWKCSVIRIPILPGKVSSQTNQVRTVVDACIANGVYAILDWHSMAGAQAGEASTYFKSMAAAYGNTPNVMYEPWNEPVTENWATIKAYHEKVIEAIRTVDPDNIIICGNPQWDQRPDLAAANPITISTNIAYSLHFYAATHKASIRSNAAAALGKGIALFSTEYGTSEASGNGTFNAAETQLWWTFLQSNGIGSANWSVSALGETSAAFNGGTSPTTWTDANLKPSGALVKAFIMSKNGITTSISIAPKGSRDGRYAIGRGASPFAGEAGADVYAIDGARITRVARSPAASGHYLLPKATAGRAKGITLIR